MFDDEKICLIICYELYRANSAYEKYIQYSYFKNYIKCIDGKKKDNYEILEYMAYSDFVVHFYLCLEGMCCREFKKKILPDASNIQDRLINHEMERCIEVLNLNKEDFLDTKEFVEKFRQMRNKLSHASIDRLVNNNLVAFKKKYDKYLQVLFSVTKNGIFRNFEKAIVEGNYPSSF